MREWPYPEQLSSSLAVVPGCLQSRAAILLSLILRLETSQCQSVRPDARHRYVNLCEPFDWADHGSGVFRAVKAQARVTPLTRLQRPQGCLPSGGNRHHLLLSSTSQFDLTYLKAVNSRSLRLAGAC